MARLRWIIICWIAGISFWIPAIIVHAIRGNRFGAGPLDIIIVTIFPVLAAVLTLSALGRRWREAFTRCEGASWMLLGIWMLGPLCFTIGASFAGGGFAQPGAWHMISLGATSFVPATFIMSTYDGTLVALGIVTIWLIVLAIKDQMTRWSERSAARRLSNS